MKTIAILFAALLTANTFGIEASAVKRLTDKSGNWLIEQFNLKEGTFGSGAASKTPEQNAMVVKALCDAPRDYKESSGPFITAPLKFILSKVNDDGTAKDVAMHEPEALQWILSALKATNNPVYVPTIEKLRARAKLAGTPQVPEFNVTQLQPTTADATAMRLALFAAHESAEKQTKEVTIDGKSVKWADALAESLAKLQKPNGSFNDDIQATAMALYALELCYKSLK